MTIGSNLNVTEGETAAEEQNREFVLVTAAELVHHAERTGGKLSDPAALDKAEEHLRLEREAYHNDPDADRLPEDSSLPELIGFEPDPERIKEIVARLREIY